MKKIFLLLLTACLLATTATAEKKTFTRDYIYQASEADSKLTAKAVAIQEMQKELLLEIGQGLLSEQTLKKLSVMVNGKETFSEEFSKKITAITAGIIEMKESDILKETWNGTTYYILAKMTVDPEDVRQKIKTLLDNKEEIGKLEDKVKEEQRKLAQAIQDKEKAERERDEAMRIAAGKTKTTTLRKPSVKFGDGEERMLYEYRWSKTAPLGFSVGYCDSWGGYVGIKSNAAFLPVQKVSASFVKEAELSVLDYNDRKYDRFAATGGGMVRLAKWYLYGGAGYGKYGKAYKVTTSDNDYYSSDLQKGVEAELGVMLRLWYFNFSAGYSTIFAAGSPQRFSDVQLGVGLNLSGEFVENIYRGKEIEGKNYRKDYGLFLLENRMSKTAPYGFVIGMAWSGDVMYRGLYLHSSWGDRSYSTLGLDLGSSPISAYGGIGLGNSKYSEVSWKVAFQYEYGLRLKLPFVNFSAGRSHMWGFVEWHFGAGFAIPVDDFWD